MTRPAWIAIGGLSALCFVLAVALAVALASGDDDDPGPGFGAGEPMIVGGDPDEMQAFEDCMEESGVEPPSPSQRQAPEGFDQALEECGDLLPEGAPPTGGGMAPLPFDPGG